MTERKDLKHEQSVEIIKSMVPILFNSKNLLSDYITNKSRIIYFYPSPSKNFIVTEKNMRRKCEFSYQELDLNEKDEAVDAIKPKWIFGAEFKSKTIDNTKEKNYLTVFFIGDRDKERGSLLPSDRIFIHDGNSQQSILIDFKNKKVGIGEKGNGGGMSISRYEKAVSFEKFNDTDGIRLEYDKENKIVSIKFYDENEIILPVCLIYNLNVNIERLRETAHPIKRLTPNIVEVYLKVCEIQLRISGNKDNPTIKIGNMIFTLQEFLVLYYSFRKGKLTYPNIVKLVQGVKQENIKRILAQIVRKNYNTVSEEKSGKKELIELIYEKATSLDIMTEEFIEQLKKAVRVLE